MTDLLICCALVVCMWGGMLALRVTLRLIAFWLERWLAADGGRRDL